MRTYLFSCSLTCVPVYQYFYSTLLGCPTIVGKCYVLPLCFLNHQTFNIQPMQRYPDKSISKAGPLNFFNLLTPFAHPSSNVYRKWKSPKFGRHFRPQSLLTSSGFETKQNGKCEIQNIFWWRPMPMFSPNLVYFCSLISENWRHQIPLKGGGQFEKWEQFAKLSII